MHNFSHEICKYFLFIFAFKWYQNSMISSLYHRENIMSAYTKITYNHVGARYKFQVFLKVNLLFI